MALCMSLEVGPRNLVVQKRPKKALFFCVHASKNICFLRFLCHFWGDTGYDGTVRVNTFHAFSFAEKRWSPVLPSANSAGPPSPRDRHVAVAFGNSFYVHGGK